ncbi:sensor histidine kinase [Streptacidiphilus melanogenes]|uniref:sensor histidine kinase n=1 Tax=Streptacidiphilus melanogenes TaxID=411235 RepID=UPI000A05A109|nr:sensor histidine kinase [Streptacidiphilus melanogenes]
MGSALRNAVSRAWGRGRRVARLLWDAAWAAPDRHVPFAPQLGRTTRLALGVTGLVVVLVLAASADQQLVQLVPSSLAWALAALQALPLLLVVSRPLAAWRLSTLGLTLATFAEVGHAPTPFWPWPVSSCIAFVVLVFVTAQRYGRDIAIGVDLLTAGAVLLPALLLVDLPPVVLGVAVVAVTLVLVLGESIHSRLEAERHLEQAEQQRRAGLARQAVLEERSRIARELHDVVAHHMSMIAIQAEAAPYKEPGLPEQTRRTFTAIREASTTALTEMRRVIGLLREEDEGAERAPQPGIDGIPDMVRAARGAGMQVDLTLTGGPDRVPSVVDVSVYRIVQEALSNAGRHAPGAHVAIEVERSAGGVRIEVIDDGGPGGSRAPLPPGGNGGHGLTGMRERAALLGGTLRAGHRRSGGFAVTAWLPMDGPRVRTREGRGESSTNGITIKDLTANGLGDEDTGTTSTSSDGNSRNGIGGPAGVDLTGAGHPGGGGLDALGGHLDVEMGDRHVNGQRDGRAGERPNGQGER